MGRVRQNERGVLINIVPQGASSSSPSMPAGLLAWTEPRSGWRLRDRRRLGILSRHQPGRPTSAGIAAVGLTSGHPLNAARYPSVILCGNTTAGSRKTLAFGVRCRLAQSPFGAGCEPAWFPQPPAAGHKR
jgi:hypothetical protein